MKKFVVAAVVMAVFASAASAEIIGTLALNENYVQLKDSMLARVLDAGLETGERSMKFYDSLMLMQLALDKGEIDALAAPDFVGEYMLRTNPALTLRGLVMFKRPIAFSFGFLE